jgi:outer membrane protein assembly factor BamA
MRFGEAPFSSMAELGGPFQMRGYFRGRYRDLNQLVLQAEYRFPLFWRFSGVAFSNVGQVYGTSKFNIKKTRWTAGAGTRFRFGKRTYVRFDVGGNQSTFAAIFNGGQAF